MRNFCSNNRNSCWRIACGVWLATLMLPMTCMAAGLDVSDYKWGFNGKVAPHRFNVLSILVNNPTAQPYNGEIVLRKTLGGAGFVDAEIVEPLTLLPNSARWVQFYPYITSDGPYPSEQWQVIWHGGNYPVQSPRYAKYQRIILDDPNSVTARGGAVKFHLDDNLFPPFVTATDALQLVVLDHAPRWEEGRRQAFLDWLHLGGTVVILQDSNGKFPDFSGPMGELKSPLEDQGYGSGRVVRLPMTRAQFSEDDLRQVCVNLPKNYHPANTEKSDDIVDHVDESQALQINQNFGYGEGTDPFRSNSFLSQLKQMTKPEHNWILLHFMFWVYIGLVFPGCYLLGKRWSDFRVVYAGLLGTVAVFSLLFSIVGQRGYGEATAVHTVAFARPLPKGGMDVASWSNVFVIGGADYEIRHNADSALYSTCNEHEQVKGAVNNGVQALFKVDIPPFSNRELAARIRLPCEGPKVTLTSFKQTDGRVTELDFDVADLKPEDVEKQYALIGSSFYGLKWKDGGLVLQNELGNVVGVLRVAERRNQYGNFYPFGADYGNKTTPAERYTQMFDLLLSRSMSVGREKEAEQFRLSPNVVRVFLYAKMPGEFAIQNKRLANQIGRVLYSIDVPLTDIKKP